MPKEMYLGDGLYASYDGWQIKLRAPRDEGDHVVYMDFSVYKAFREFAEKVVEQQPISGMMEG